MNNTLIFIVGPTGVGKTDAGFLLAQRIGGEIVSCDAMQVYREVNIACDKPSADMRRQVPHHMIDVVSVTEAFDVARFRALAIEAIDGIQKRGKVPVITGGSGMYMAVLLDGIFKTDVRDEALRGHLQQEAQTQGPEVLHQRLALLDPQAAIKIHSHDAKRIIRALEVVMTAGRPISQLQKEREGLWGHRPIKLFALDRPRASLYRRVEERIERMFAQGLVEEVRALAKLPLGRTAAALIGIPEVSGYLNGEYDLQRAKYLMKLKTRHYVKRQLTWFRRDERLKWINIEEGASAGEIADQICRKKESYSP